MSSVKKNYPRVIFVTLSLFFSACTWLDNEVQIPSYVHIPEYHFQALPGEGTSSHNITDAWVFVNGQKIGAFQLPATVPVLASGKSTFDIFPGIKLNGIAATRAIYTFYSRYTSDVELYPDSMITIIPSCTYVDGLSFDFIEDFESIGVVFDKTDRSDTTLMKTDDAEHVFEGQYSGYIALENNITFFEAKSINAYSLPKTGGFSFIEINCKSTIPFVVGLFANEFNYSTRNPIVVVTPSDNWKKIYVNLTPTVSRFQQAFNFNVLIAAQLDETETQGRIWIDNIKLLHY
jgi:hypothetical protein